MQNLVFTQLSIPEFQQIFREELQKFFSQQKSFDKPEPDEIGGIDLAETITGLKPSTIYSLISQRKIPHFKRGKRVYFSREELTAWLRSGKRQTQSEIAADAGNYSRTSAKHR